MPFRQDIKDLQRLREILVVMLEEGLGYYISRSKLRAHLPFHKKLRVSLPVNDRTKQAIFLRRAFERLGPTFIKLGQLLSLRPDLVPPEYSLELEKLQDHVPPVPFAQIKKVVEEDLQKPLSAIFRSFERKPLASASIAQVHKAVLKSGKVVAVKVQRPEIKERIDADLDILFHLAEQLEKHVTRLRGYQPSQVVKEFALWTRRELNFEMEARNTTVLKQEMKKNAKVYVPAVYPEFSTRRVLTLEFIHGHKLNDLPALKQQKVNRKNIAMTYLLSILEQALIHGLFHADPHPGNIFVDSKGRLVYLDCGIMGELSEDDRHKVIRFILSIEDKDSDKSIGIILSLARQVDQTRVAEFKREALPILEEVYLKSISQASIGKALYDIIGLGARHNILFDPSHVLIAKAIYQAEGLALRLDPQFRIAQGMQRFADHYLKEEYSPLKLASSLKKKILSNKTLLLDLPERITRIIHNLEHPPIPDQVRRTDLAEIERKLEDTQTHKSLGFMIFILFVASLFLFYMQGKQDFLGLPLHSLLLLFALLIFIYFLFFHRKHIRGVKQHEKNC